MIFGKFHGMLYNLAADVLGASISFYLGRYFLHGVARGFLETRMPWLDRKAAEDGFSVIFYLRIFWFPFIVLNYAAGATRIRFRDYLLGTFLGLLPPVFIFTYFVGAMKEVLATYRRPADLLTFDLLFPVLLLVFSFFLPTLLKRLRKGRELLPPAGSRNVRYKAAMMPARISVIIPALDEEASIARAIRSCREAGPCEVIVVDGGSRDRTVEIARGRGRRRDRRAARGGRRR